MPEAPGGNGHADLVLTGGAVYTGVATGRPAQALAVRGGAIVAVGADRDIVEHVGPGTRRLDLGGRMVVPGFQDAHVHPSSAGMAFLRCDLHSLPGLPAYEATLRTYATANPDVPWILGSGWAMTAFPGGTPRKETLDAIVPDRPAYLVNRDGHGAWVNSKALEMAGIGGDGSVERPTPRTVWIGLRLL